MPRFLTGISSNPPPAVAAAPPEAVNVESDLVVILAALLCALICVVGLIAVLRCACLRRNTADTSSQSHLANKGLKKKIIHSIPKLTYTTSSCSDSECAICLNEFREKDEIRVLPHCSHAFHVACIDTWLGSHSSCPSCRHVLAVARCQRCGQFPAVSSSSSSSAHPKATGHTPHAPTFLP